MIKKSLTYKKAKVLPLSRQLSKEQIDQMAELESKYFSSEYAQDKNDMLDDLSQEGAVGVGLFDNNKILKGHLYGYNMTPDEVMIPDLSIYDLIENYNVKIFEKVPDDFLNFIKKKMSDGKIFYVANFVVDSGARIGAIKLISKLLADLKSKGYEYITFDALSDTFKLFMNPDMTPKTDRLSKFGLTLLAIIPVDLDRAQALIKL